MTSLVTNNHYSLPNKIWNGMKYFMNRVLMIVFLVMWGLAEMQVIDLQDTVTNLKKEVASNQVQLQQTQAELTTAKAEAKILQEKLNQALVPESSVSEWGHNHIVNPITALFK